MIEKDESLYRAEGNSLGNGSKNDLELNVKTTKKDFRRNPTEMASLLINGDEVEIVEPFKFLGTTISND